MKILEMERIVRESEILASALRSKEFYALPLETRHAFQVELISLGGQKINELPKWALDIVKATQHESENLVLI